MIELKLSAASRIGCVRHDNEDMVLAGYQFIRNDEYRTHFELGKEDRYMMAVADGMGGHQYGEVASSEVLHNLQFFFSDLPVGLNASSFNEMIVEWLDSINGDPRALKSTFVIKDLLFKLKNSYDYVFFDVGPSLGALNRVILFACDYFVMPMSSDVFSVKAIDNISITLKDWKEELDDGLYKYRRKENENYTVDDEECNIDISFLGYVHQQYTAKMQNNERRPVRAYDRIIRQMPQRINSKFRDFFPSDFDPEKLKLGDIPNFNSLIPLSQLANKPIFSLIGKDGVVGAHFSKVKDYEEVISRVIQNVVLNIQAYDGLER